MRADDEPRRRPVEAAKHSTAERPRVLIALSDRIDGSSTASADSSTRTVRRSSARPTSYVHPRNCRDRRRPPRTPLPPQLPMPRPEPNVDEALLRVSLRTLAQSTGLRRAGRWFVRCSARNSSRDQFRLRGIPELVGGGRGPVRVHARTFAPFCSSPFTDDRRFSSCARQPEVGSDVESVRRTISFSHLSCGRTAAVSSVAGSCTRTVSTVEGTAVRRRAWWSGGSAARPAGRRHAGRAAGR